MRTGRKTLSMLRRWMIVLAALFPALPAVAQTASVLDVPATQVAAGLGHTCAVTAQGNVRCWGDNGRGQLGNPALGIGGSSAVPVDAPMTSPGVVAAIALGSAHVCALRTDSGGVMCWGGNDAGQLGNGDTADTFSKIYVTGLSGNVAAITAGQRHTCALTTSGGVKCWGDNSWGQLGTGSLDQPGSLVPVDVTDLPADVVAIGAGAHHTCALTSTGAVKCWGANFAGQLGSGSTTPSSVATPVDVVNLGGAVAAIATGSDHTCALMAAGGVRCWGANGAGQLGYDHTTLIFVPYPIVVQGLASDVAAIAAGASHTCALTADGGVSCWGLNMSGQLGDGTTIDHDAPTAATGLSSGVAALAPGGNHTCVLVADGGLRCFGANSLGQLGNGNPGSSALASTAVSAMAAGVISIAAGGAHTCVLTSAGGAQCWGDHSRGQLGNPAPGERHVPTPVYGLDHGLAALAAGAAHTCALTAAGGVQCWGDNIDGQLGVGDTMSFSYIPRDLTALGTGIAAVATGYYHTCALLSGGSVKCWGANGTGQLGDGSTTNRYLPVAVDLGGSAIAIAGGGYHTCALMSGGGVKCWGNNDGGQLGHGDSGNIYTAPVDVAGLPGGATAIAAGAFHACAVAGGGVYCWGSGYKGQLGNGGTSASTAPVAASGLGSDMATIAAGFYHTCALGNGGGVWCWGDNEQGALGDGGTTDSVVPVEVAGSGVAAITTGSYHTCALTIAGGIACWGRGSNGQLGNDSVADVHAPVSILAGQRIAFAPPPMLPSGTNLAALASVSSGAAAGFDSWTPDTCGFSGDVLVVHATGLCGLRASQSGGGDGAGSTFAAAPQQLRLVRVDGDRIFGDGFDAASTLRRPDAL